MIYGWSTLDTQFNSYLWRSLKSRSSMYIL